MKPILFLVLFVSFAIQAQDSVAGKKPVVTYTKDGVSVKSYSFDALEPRLATNSDSIYVVNFWATWCAPCVKELPFFEQLNSQYKGKKVKVLLVSLDMRKQVESALIPFINRKKIQSEVVHIYETDANTWIPKVDSEWTGALPATLIFTKGKRKFYEQSFTYETLEAALKAFTN